MIRQLIGMVVMASQLRLHRVAASHARGADPVWLADQWPLAALGTTSPFVHIARSEAQLAAVGRMLDELYAPDSDRAQGARHRSFIDPTDRRSLVFFAEQDDRMLASVRLTPAGEVDGDSHLELLVQAVKPQELGAVMVVSRLAVRRELAARAITLPLIRQVHRSARLAGARQSFTASRRTLQPLLAPFGWRRTGLSFCDPAVGELDVYRIDLHD